MTHNFIVENTAPQRNIYLQFGERACSHLHSYYNQAISSTKAVGRTFKNWTTSLIKPLPLLAKICSLWASFLAACAHLIARWSGLCHLERELHPSERFNHNYRHIPPKIGRYYSANLRVGETADDGYRWKKALLRSATKSIEISANFAGGKEFRKILSIIEKRMCAEQNLKTHIILNPEVLEKKDSFILKRLKEKFQDRFEFLIYKPHVHLLPRIHTEENHVKALVVDEKYFVIGGTSLHPRLCREKEKEDHPSQKSFLSLFVEKTTRDNDLIGENVHSAGAVRQQFFNLFALCEKRVGKAEVKNRFFRVKGSRGFCPSFHAKVGLIPNARVKILVSGPEHEGMNPITKQYVTRITKAKKDITLANLDFFPENKIRNALSEKRKVHNHVPVTVITGGCPKKAALTTRISTFFSRHYYKLADTVYEYSLPHQLYHKKIAVFDNTHTLIGSYNLGKKSALFDYEIACVVKDSRVARSMKKILRKDQAQSKKITRDKIEQQPGFNNFLYKLSSFLEMFF